MPTPQQVTVALEALRDDATVWSDDAGTLKAAQSTAESLRLPAPPFSFAGGQLAAAYDALVTRVATLLDQGGTNFTTVAAALRASADAYEADEQAHVHQLQSLGR